MGVPLFRIQAEERLGANHRGWYDLPSHRTHLGVIEARDDGPWGHVRKAGAAHPGSAKGFSLERRLAFAYAPIGHFVEEVCHSSD